MASGTRVTYLSSCGAELGQAAENTRCCTRLEALEDCPGRRGPGQQASVSRLFRRRRAKGRWAEHPVDIQVNGNLYRWHMEMLPAAPGDPAPSAAPPEASAGAIVQLVGADERPFVTAVRAERGCCRFSDVLSDSIRPADRADRAGRAEPAVAARGPVSPLPTSRPKGSIWLNEFYVVDPDRLKTVQVGATCCMQRSACRLAGDCSRLEGYPCSWTEC